MKGPILLEDIILIVCVPKRGSNYVRQNLIGLHGQIDEPNFIAGDFSTPLSEMERPSM